jgi:hypothetical protein
VQEVDAKAPTAGEYRPAEQFVHALAPETEAKDPAAQSMQALAAINEYLPALQLEQLDEPAKEA